VIGKRPNRQLADRIANNSTLAVSSKRLSTDAAVKNRLFPKTRSWFALDAPLELLSPLSVLRILYALAIAIWIPIAVLVRGPGENLAIVVIAIACAAVVWITLAVVPRLGNEREHLLFFLLTALIACLIWAGNGTAVSYLFLMYAFVVVVAAAIFHSIRSLSAQIALFVIVAGATFAMRSGVAVGVADGFMVALAAFGASATVLFLTRAASRQGSIDPDTGLPNGIGLSRRIANGTQPSFVVAVIRLDGIDDARRALGYEVGTELLRRAVEDLGQVLPPATFIGRIDGDELVITAGFDTTCEGPTERADREEEAIALAQTLSGAIAAGRYLVADIEVSLRSHVGLAIAPWDGEEIPELVRCASLSAGRAADKGQVHQLWGGDFGEMTAGDLSLLADLRLAGEKGELFLAYQPQIAPVSNRVASVEALLRWNSATLGSVPPARFIPLAERTGLIHRLTDWILDEALDAQARWRAVGIDLPVSVNLSPTSLRTSDLPERILAGLESRGLPCRCLTLEVTETAAIDVLQAVTLLRPLHDRGVRISIDDFGTGYTSLSVLPDLPLDELKVDQRFVLRLQESPTDDAIVRTVRELALRLGLDAVAEGVETGELYEQMQTYGFDLLQGYFFARPLEESQLLEYVRKASESESPPFGASITDRYVDEIGGPSSEPITNNATGLPLS
jgi:diguanylate cyclase